MRGQARGPVPTTDGIRGDGIARYPTLVFNSPFICLIHLIRDLPFAFSFLPCGLRLCLFCALPFALLSFLIRVIRVICLIRDSDKLPMLFSLLSL